jgi:PAS domain S-box-containing protein
MGKPNSFILLVDDDAGKRYTLAKTLIRAGFLVREAKTGGEALEMLSARPDLVILDVKLPDISGFEVCRRIKSDPATSVIPVLHISTTFVHLEDKIQGLDSGADGYLTNVAEPMELIATVRALLRARRAEETAQLTTRQWQTTFDAISDGVMLLDASGRIVQANRTLEHILGRTWSEIVGRELPALWDQRAQPEDSPFARMLVSGAREAEDLSLGDLWLHVSVDPLRNASGEINGALCIVADITHRKRMEMQLFRQAEELQKTSQRKDEFLAMLAHELRNPLAPLANTLQIIRMQLKGNELVDNSLDIAGRQIEHMTRLLEDLFDVSRTTRGMVELRRKLVDLNTVVNHAVEAVFPLVESLGHELTNSLPREAIHVEGDPTRLEQIVLNLLNNAAKYTEPGGKIAVTLSQEADLAVLRVSDSGIGITPEMQTNIFDLFVQADRSLDRARGGLGIGLTLVRSLVELHGGTISVFSSGTGQGSTFTVKFKVVSVPPLEKARAIARPVECGVRQLRILIVDDNRDSARTLARVLEFDGHTASCIFDGLAVTQSVASFRPDFVLLDIGLPGLDGFQVAEQLRRSFSKQELTLVAVTGYGEERDHALAKLAGFDHYLVKPLDLGVLKRLLSAREPTIV